jgi:hypothetical protein
MCAVSQNAPFFTSFLRKTAIGDAKTLVKAYPSGIMDAPCARHALPRAIALD